MLRERITAGNPTAPLIDHRFGQVAGAGQQGLPGPAGHLAGFARLAKAIAAALLIVAGLAAAPARAAGGEAPADFIRILGNQGLEVIRSNTTLTEKAAYFHRMLHQDFNLTAISRFVLGPFWRTASDAQREEFRHLLGDHLVRFYGRQFARYGGESLRVTDSRTDPAGVIVTSQIIRPWGSPIDVDWRLAISDGRYRIVDVIIDGISMAGTQRSEFAAMIQRSGGQLEGLLAIMRAAV